VVSKLDLVVVAAVVACGMMWVERGHRVSIEAPLPAETTFRDATCPDNDSVPYTARCLAFLEGSSPPNRHDRTSWAHSETALAASRLAIPSTSGGECPDNDNRPYPPGCVRFLSGWFWRAN
jgi:hypothetical protein